MQDIIYLNSSFMQFLKPFLLLFSLFFLLSFSGAIERKEPVAISDTLHINYLSPGKVPLTDSIVNFGKVFLNTPYHFGSPGTSSFDCSGFTSYVYRNFGYNLKRSSAEQAEQFDTVQPEELKTGDLVYFSGRSHSKRVGHVGIVVNKNENGTFDFIHAAVHKGVTISNSDEAYYSRRFVKANRVVGFDPFSVVRSAVADNISNNLNDEPIAPIMNNANVQRINKHVPAEYHRVKKGETLSSIAEKYGMSIAELKDKNRIKGSKLSLKQQLKVKDEETVMVVESGKALAENAKPELQTAKKQLTAENINSLHTVKSGETLFSIAKANNTTVSELEKLNDLPSGKIRLGQELKVAQSTEVTSNIAANKVKAEVKPISYKVKKGETLSSISKKYNISKEELKASNNLKSNNLRLGQNLQIAQAVVSTSNIAANKIEATPISYKVKKGETLSSISKKYNITEDELKAMNNLKSSNIRFDQELKVNQPLEVAAVNNGTKNTKAEPSVVTYKVKKGETLSDIAEKNNVSVTDLKSLNNLHSSSIRSGQQLQLTGKDAQSEKETVAKAEKTIVHKVESGESLYVIAKKYNVAIDELKRLNNLEDGKIKPGQSLSVNVVADNSTVEKTVVKPTITHKVKSGDSFYSLAKKYGCSVHDIKDWNRIPGDKLNLGEKLIIYSKNI